MYCDDSFLTAIEHFFTINFDYNITKSGVMHGFAVPGRVL